RPSTAQGLSQMDGGGYLGDEQIPQQLRRDYLVDVIIKTIARLVPPDHKEFLNELERVFSTVPRQQQEERSSANTDEIDSVQSTVQRLAVLAMENERTRNEVFTALQEAALGSTATA